MENKDKSCEWSIKENRNGLKYYDTECGATGITKEMITDSDKEICPFCKLKKVYYKPKQSEQEVVNNSDKEYDWTKELDEEKCIENCKECDWHRYCPAKKYVEGIEQGKKLKAEEIRKAVERSPGMISDDGATYWIDADEVIKLIKEV